MPFGFALSCTLPGETAPSFNIIALRGTKTYEEWVNDAESYPTSFELYNSVLGIVDDGFVHGGIYAVYTRGEPGAKQDEERPTGSLAAQISAIMELIKANRTKNDGKTIPLYITGHSLGAALAVLCAADVGANFGVHGAFKEESEYFSELLMYNLAPPRVAAGFSAKFPVVGAVGFPAEKFIEHFQGTYGTTNSFRIVHAADIVPILPPADVTLSTSLGIRFEFAHPKKTPSTSAPKPARSATTTAATCTSPSSPTSTAAAHNQPNVDRTLIC